LKEALGFYNFQFVRINLSSEAELIRAFQEYGTNTNIIVVARGGGDNMSVFNKPSLAEEALSLKCFFLTAIGHKEDESLLQKVADKAFITPTALGQYFNEIYNRTIEELQNTRAKLVEDITTQLKSNYEMKLTNLNEQLKGHKEVSEQQLQLANTQLNDLKSQLQKKPAIPSVVWLLILLIAVVAGILIGYFFLTNLQF
jgi:exodeoxyribonuclease VII large subunit